MIRWAIQRKTFPLTKTINSARMKENRNVFDFYLKSEDMKAIDNLNINKRYNDPGVFTLGMGTFCPIYE
jgi:diketogulonate reductase-like aldo/keto reductase